MRLTDQELLKLNDLFTPAELIEALDLEDMSLLDDVLYQFADEIREILEEY